MSVEVRKLDVFIDRSLYEEAYHWDESYPRWYRQMDQVFRPTLVGFLKGATENDQADVGVWHEGQFIALISFVELAPLRLEINLWAKRKACTEAIAWAAYNQIQGLFQNGAREITAWLSNKNLPVKKLCILAGLKADGLRTWRKGPRVPLCWERYSVRC